MSQDQETTVISVDVGTTSVRLAIITFSGQDRKQARVLASQDKNIDHFQDGNRFEQKSEQIFRAICDCCKACMQRANIDPSSISAIGFSATCSLVIHNIDDQSNDVIMWMDHRAVEEAQSVTSSRSKVLNQFGGVCSPEFSLSKLLWLRANSGGRLESATGLFELPDWLVYRCIGGDPTKSPRSMCSLVCKWGLDAASGRHCDIVDLSFDDATKRKFGTTFLKPGTMAGLLSTSTAAELGLLSDVNALPNLLEKDKTYIAVGTSLIDAHAGMLAMLSLPNSLFGSALAIETKFCSLAGTSSCHMLLSGESKFVRGIWGPYRSVVLDEFHLLEAGQSMTGKLVELCIEHSVEGRQMLDAGVQIREIIENLNRQIGTECPTSPLHVLPSYHGNRSPLANPRLRGGIYGLSAQCSTLLESYIAHIEAIAFETRSIVEALDIRLACILVSGGLSRNNFYMQTLANILDCRAVKIGLPNVDVMVMGSALVARRAAINSLQFRKDSDFLFKDQQPLTEENIKDLKWDELSIESFAPSTISREYLEQKYLCYKEFVQLSRNIDAILQKESK